jgi:hypothetical protein
MFQGTDEPCSEKLECGRRSTCYFANPESTIGKCVPYLSVQINSEEASSETDTITV